MLEARADGAGRDGQGQPDIQVLQHNELINIFLFLHHLRVNYLEVKGGQAGESTGEINFEEHEWCPWMTSEA